MENETNNQNQAVETLVKSVLLYNYGIWGVSKDDQRKLNSFHRNQLRKVVGIRWPQNI